MEPLHIIIITPDVGYDYISTLFNNDYLTSVLLFALDDNKLLVNLTETLGFSRRPDLEDYSMAQKWIKILDPLIKNNNVISSKYIAQYIKNANNIDILLPINPDMGISHIQSLEKDIIPPSYEVQLEELPELPLSYDGKLIYIFRPDIIAGMFKYYKKHPSFFNDYSNYMDIVFPTHRKSTHDFMDKFIPTEKDIKFFASQPEFKKDTLKAIWVGFYRWGLEYNNIDVVIDNENKFISTIGNDKKRDRFWFIKFLKCLKYVSPDFFDKLKELLNTIKENKIISDKLIATFLNT